MSTISHRRQADIGTAPTESPGAGAPSTAAFRYVIASIRLSLGWIFLWAFLDKLFGLGHETAAKAAWIHGGHPTLGFLKFGTKGPFADVYRSFAGAAWADWLFMAGLAGIGIALIAGIAMRLAAAAGVVLLVLMWTAVLPPANNPFLDEHLVYALTLVAITMAGAGHTLGLGRRWDRLPVVRDHAALQ
jgi:thiosulfate dehydrogenase (quinone) large subunit